MQYPKRIHIIILLILSYNITCYAQTIEEPLDNHFYKKELHSQKQPIPYQYIRESDIIWSTLIWRTIDLREKFNQFFYYPIDPEGVEGRINFTYLLWNAAKNNMFQIYEDDELKIPIDNDQFFTQYLKADTIQLEIYDDEYEEEFHYETTIVPKEFYSEDIKQYQIKEVWYIEKEISRQQVRLIGLSMIKDKFKTIGGEEEYIGSFPLFWIPMQSMAVRKLMVRNQAYYEDNVANLPSWEEIFQTHTYTSFVIRESNRHNRWINEYLTGEDALLEAERVEDKLFEIGSDMWEY